MQRRCHPELPSGLSVNAGAATIFSYIINLFISKYLLKAHVTGIFFFFLLCM